MKLNISLKQVIHKSCALFCIILLNLQIFKYKSSDGLWLLLNIYMFRINKIKPQPEIPKYT